METNRLYRTIHTKQRWKQFHLNGLWRHSSGSDIALAFAFAFTWCDWSTSEGPGFNPWKGWDSGHVSLNHSLTVSRCKNGTSKCGENLKVPPVVGLYKSDTCSNHVKVLAYAKVGWVLCGNVSEYISSPQGDGSHQGWVSSPVWECKWGCLITSRWWLTPRLGEFPAGKLKVLIVNHGWHAVLH